MTTATGASGNAPLYVAAFISQDEEINNDPALVGFIVSYEYHKGGGSTGVLRVARKYKTRRAALIAGRRFAKEHGALVENSIMRVMTARAAATQETRRKYKAHGGKAAWRANLKRAKKLTHIYFATDDPTDEPPAKQQRKATTQ